MRTKVFKTVLPIAVLALGLASAASTSSLKGSDKDASQTGYRKVASPFSCTAVQICDEGGTWDCKASNGDQLYAPQATCQTSLKRSTEF